MHLQLELHILSPLRASRPPTTTTTEHLTKDIIRTPTTTATAARLEPLLPVFIVELTFFRVCEDLESTGNLLELLRVTTFVRVVLVWC